MISKKAAHINIGSIKSLVGDEIGSLYFYKDALGGVGEKRRVE